MTQNRKDAAMENKIPKGVDLLKTLIDLLADQEGVKIKCEVVSNEAR